jgi:hypothetical protein
LADEPIRKQISQKRLVKLEYQNFTIVWHDAAKIQESKIGEKLLDFGSQTEEFGKLQSKIA